MPASDERDDLESLLEAVAGPSDPLGLPRESPKNTAFSATAGHWWHPTNRWLRLLPSHVVLLLLSMPAGAAPPPQGSVDSSPVALDLLEDGPTRIARGLLAGPYAGGPEEAALAFLAEHGPALGNGDSTAWWTPARVRSWRGRTLVRLQQLHGGIPVMGGGATVVLDGRSRVTMVNASVRDGLTVDTSPVVTADRAVEIAVDHLGIEPSAAARPVLAISPARAGGALIYQVHLSTARPLGSWMVTLDYEIVEGEHHEYEIPVGRDFDRELDGEVDGIVLSAADEDIDLLPDTTYYMALIHQNCAAVTLTIETEISFAEPETGDDDDDDGGGCSCRQDAGRRTAAGAIALASLATLGLLRRRRANR